MTKFYLATSLDAAFLIWGLTYRIYEIYKLSMTAKGRAKIR